MKFESKFGMSEIVVFETRKNGKRVADELIEVCGILFQKNSDTIYICRWPRTGYMQNYTESDLIGDPDFDQDAGKYTADIEEELGAKGGEMSELNKTAPAKIYLCVGDDSSVMDANFADLGDVTWAEDLATNYGVEYVRADVMESIRADVLALCEAVLNNIGHRIMQPTAQYIKEKLGAE